MRPNVSPDIPAEPLGGSAEPVAPPLTQESRGQCWPEQEAVEAWWALHRGELKEAATRERLLIQADRDRLRALLREWLETPFFATEEEWARWVRDFRPRVEAAL